jgi:glycosyltransferase involved in cell wall biosynthesis
MYVRLVSMDNVHKRVFIFTNFNSYQRSFSPIIVVGEQLKMLGQAGYNPILIVSDGWEPPEDSIFSQVETKYLSPVVYQDPPVINEIFEEDVELVYRQLEEIIPANSVVLTHDLIFLPDYTKHHIAARRLAEKESSIRWIHWVHSATGPAGLINERNMYGDKYRELLGSKFPNSVIAYPNAEDIPRVARNFGYEEFEVFEVPHSTDPTEGMHPIVQRLYRDRKLGNAEVLMIYPIRFDRGKVPEMNVRIIGALKQADVVCHLVFCDFQSTGGDKITLKEECKRLARDLNVENNITFLSEFDDVCHLEVSHDIILDLFTLSNVFCMPSRSETYSLITQEAMLKGNLCVLNYDFPAFRQIYGDKAIYRKFSGAEVGMDGFDGKIDTTHSDIDSYFKERIAIPIKGWLQYEKVLKGKTWVRTKRNPDYVFKEYVEPLILGFEDAKV